MKKLRLEIEELAVESFDVAAAREPEGTVLAHGNTFDGGQTCDGGNTCWDSCDGVCGTYYCITDGSCWNISCVYTCLVACSQPNTNYSCLPGQC